MLIQYISVTVNLSKTCAPMATCGTMYALQYACFVATVSKGVGACSGKINTSINCTCPTCSKAELWRSLASAFRACSDLHVELGEMFLPC